MQLEDTDILSIIKELSARRGRVGLPLLRTTLKERFGASCGTDRLSRLLHQHRTAALEPPRVAALCDPPPLLEPDALTQRVTFLEQALENAKEALAKEQARAERAEAREEAHQDKWANEIYELRQRLAAVNPDRASATAKECEFLRIQNRHLTRLVADLRIAFAQAEQQLLSIQESRSGDSLPSKTEMPVGVTAGIS